jgi:hypothetical protein
MKAILEIAGSKNLDFSIISAIFQMMAIFQEICGTVNTLGSPGWWWWMP